MLHYIVDACHAQKLKDWITSPKKMTNYCYGKYLFAMLILPEYICIYVYNYFGLVSFFISIEFSRLSNIESSKYNSSVRAFERNKSKLKIDEE